MAATLTRYQFSVADYDEMIDAGFIDEDDRVELIRGEIVHKMPIGDLHVACVNRLNRLLQRQLGDDAIVSVQNPIRLRDSEPEPDVALLRPRADFYASGKPTANDALLVIEVADTSLEIDRDVKRELYAQAGVVEYWIVNLLERCVEVHRQPQSNGHYSDVSLVTPGQTIQMTAVPNGSIAVDQIL